MSVVAPIVIRGERSYRFQSGCRRFTAPRDRTLEARLHALPQNSINHARLVADLEHRRRRASRPLRARREYRDVILPFTVLRRLDSVLEPTQDAVLAMKRTLDQAGIVDQDAPLRDAAKQDFYNTSGFAPRRCATLPTPPGFARTSRHTSMASRQMCRRSSTTSSSATRLPRLTKADALGELIEVPLARPRPFTRRLGQPRDGHGLREEARATL